MKTILMNLSAAAILLLMPLVNFAQAPNLGTAAGFVLFSSNGAVSNTGISQLTGNIGTNSGSSTAFGNVNGVMHDNDGASAQCAADLLIAYNQLNSTIPTFFPAPLLGNGATLVPGVYSIGEEATLNLGLTLDAQGDANAVFIFQIQGAFSANAASKIYLKNGALACNVFWKVEGLVSMASGSTMRGTIIANNAAIVMSSGDTLEGRALLTVGALTTSAITTTMISNCTLTGIPEVKSGNTNKRVSIYPNPFKASVQLTFNDLLQGQRVEFMLYNALGVKVMSVVLSKQSTLLNTSGLPSGIYIYNIISDTQLIQSGRLVSRK